MRRSITRALRDSEIDVVSAHEARRDGLSDDEHLQFASAEGRVIYTANVGECTRLNRNWLQVGLHHAGIIVLTDQLLPVGRHIQALRKLVATLSAEAMADRVEFLSNWLD